LIVTLFLFALGLSQFSGSGRVSVHRQNGGHAIDKSRGNAVTSEQHGDSINLRDFDAVTDQRQRFKASP
jgi:hypothetical protein